MLGPALLGTLRTFVPVAVGFVITRLLDIGVALDEEAVNALNVFLLALITSAYYLVVTVLERKVHPYFGILLGAPKAPADYVPGGGDTATAKHA